MQVKVKTQRETAKRPNNVGYATAQPHNTNYARAMMCVVCASPECKH